MPTDEQQAVESTQPMSTVSWTGMGAAPMDNTAASGGYKYGLVTGRINAVATDPANPAVAYAGATAGGLWKTTNCCTSQLPGAGGFGSTPTVPAAPSNLGAAAASSGQINLRWTDNASDETGFKIERSSDGASWVQITTVGSNVTTYANTGLAKYKNYYYRVRAYNAIGNSPYFNTVTAKTLST